MPEDFTHLDPDGRPRMVDVGGKKITARTAVACCNVTVGKEILSRFEDGELRTKKGGVIQTAVVAGIMGAKQTSSLVPMCHPLPLDHCSVEISTADDAALVIHCTCKTNSRTGVEMEALTGASVAALTIYDMCKSMNPGIVISDLRLLEKTGGKSDFQR